MEEKIKGLLTALSISASIVLNLSDMALKNENLPPTVLKRIENYILTELSAVKEIKKEKG